MNFFKYIILFVTFFFFKLHALDSWIIVDNNTHITINQGGDITKRRSPCSTFKIPLCLMGFDSGILIDSTNPVWPYSPSEKNYLEQWKKDHDPQSWIKNSCVWYSEILTQKLGLDRFKAYIDLLNYGNKNIEGHAGQGLTNCWLSSSLKISPKEQIAFLIKLSHYNLPFSLQAHQKTMELLEEHEFPSGWKIYGKTGSGCDSGLIIGWYIGWLEYKHHRYYFAYLIETEATSNVPPSQLAKKKLINLLNKHLDF